MRTLFVTVGSTRFQSLTDAVLSSAVLDVLASAGVSKLIVQLGSATIPAHVGVVANGGEWKYRDTTSVTVLRYTDDAAHMARLLASADAVVSHAGALRDSTSERG